MNDFDALLIFFIVQRRSLDEFLVSLVLLVCQWQTFSLTFALKLCKDTCHFDSAASQFRTYQFIHGSWSYCVKDY